MQKAILPESPSVLYTRNCKLRTVRALFDLLWTFSITEACRETWTGLALLAAVNPLTLLAMAGMLQIAACKGHLLSETAL